MDDWTPLFLQVVGWSQTIANGELHQPYQFSVMARTSDIEDLVYGAEGFHWLRNMPVQLNLIRGKPEKLPEHGIGRLVYYPERPAQDNMDGIDQFVGGWFWLPETSYDEMWMQARNHRYDEGMIELFFGPVEPAGGTRRWNTEKNKAAWIVSAAVRFERKIKPPVDDNAPLPAQPKKRGFFP